MCINETRRFARSWSARALQAAAVIALIAVSGALPVEVGAAAPAPTGKSQSTGDDPCRFATAEAVVLVTGDSGIDRDAVFNGFNTPLLPDILVCTQVGQEGIDLHRHCRHVVHYDLGWNPATLEQRTGRTDRLGSKAMRERNLALAARNGAGGSDASASPPSSCGLSRSAGTASPSCCRR